MAPGSRLWIVAAVLAVVAYVVGLVPALVFDSPADALRYRLDIRVVACVLAFVFLVIGVRRNRPAVRSVWIWTGVLLVGNLGRPVLINISSTPIAGGWLNLTVITWMSCCQVIILLLIIRSRGTSRVTDARLEMIVLLLAYAAFVIPLSALPGWHATKLLPYQIALGIVGPAAYVILVALVGRLLMVDLLRGRAAVLLMAGWIALIFADVAGPFGRSIDNPLIDPARDVVALSVLLWAAAALHPSMRSITEPTDAYRGEWSLPRTATVVIAAALPLVVPMINPQLTEPERLLVFSLGALAVGTSVIRTRRAVSALAHAERKSAWQARRDELTGLLNRRGLVEHAATIHGPVGVVYLDVDRFKLLNDVNGHHFGDALLIAIGRRLNSLPEPIVAAARFGGDEFAMLFAADTPHHTPDPTRQVRHLIDRLFDTPVDVDQRPIQVSASVGLAVSAGTDEQFLQTIGRADIAQYYAKADGGGHIRDYVDDMGQERKRHKLILELLQQRVGTTDETWLAYQAIVDLRTGHPIGAEALARMRTDELGTISPGEFVTLAEQNGAIETLGNWAFDTVVATIDDVGTQLPDGFRIAVNISPLQLESDAQIERLTTLATQRPDVLNRIRLEITESVFVRESSLQRLTELRQAGYQLAIDDFGSEYASLYYLAQLDVDVLKIDQKFTRRLVTDPATRLIVRHVIELADQLGIAVVTEGVESEAERNQLITLGCKIGQGYLWERPTTGVNRFLTTANATH
ncbi:bifunctional diguanylate cyclase/phosphodiesterase [Skermania piniformis]